MAVQDHVDPGAPEGILDGGAIDVHQRHRLGAGMRLAAFARVADHGRASAQRQPQERPLQGRVAHGRAQLLVGHVVDAQRIAMRHEQAAAGVGHNRRVGEQGSARGAGEAGADQEVAVAVHHVQGDAAAGDVGQRADHPLELRVGIVVAEPRLEQVAEYVQRRRAACLALQELEAATRDVRRRPRQVQVGDDERGHRTPC